MMTRARLVSAVVLASALVAGTVFGQALEFSLPLRFDYVHGNDQANAPILASDLGGAVCISATTTSVTCRNAAGTEYVATITGSGGGATITAGVPDPTGGSAGDAYIQVDASDVVQSIWTNVAGTWSEFAIPTAGTSTDDQTAAEVDTATTNFDGYLDSADTTVQAALDVLDDAQRVYVASGTTTQPMGAPNLVTAPVYPPFATADKVLGATVIFKTATDWATSNVAINLTVGTALPSVLERADGDSITSAELEADTAYLAVYDGSRWQIPGILLEQGQVVLGNLVAALQARLLPDSPADDQVARYDSGTSAWVAEDLNDVTANPGARTTRLDNIMIGDDGYEVSPGAGIYLTASATYTEAENTIEATVFGGWNPERGDAVLVILPGNFGSSTNPLDLEITYAGGVHDYPLLNFDGTAVTAAELVPNALIEAFHLLIGGNRRWVLIEPTDLTEAEAEDSTSTRFGLVSGQRLRQALAAAGWIDLSDTPSTYTDQARRFTRVNVAETAMEFVDEPTNPNTIPHVGRLPEVADDSPVLVFLTHDEISGSREDATFDVARSGSQCGFSDGAIFNSFGAISKPSPIEMIFGVWDGTDSTCNLSTVHSLNEGFIDDIQSIAYSAGGSTGTCALGTRFQEFGHATKRILSCSDLNAVALGDITINFLYEDGIEAYWNDGSVDHRAGLYEKVGTPPTYHDLAPPEDAHKTGEGSAACGDSEPPDAAGQICVTSDGRGYFAMPRTSLVTSPATISVAAATSGHFVPDLYEAMDLQTRTLNTDGDFIYIKDTQEFYQFQNPNYAVVTWMEAWQYVIDNVGDTPARQAFLASTWLGEFASETEVLVDRDGYTTPLPAQATATVSGGSVTAITIDYGGSGYTAAPTITIEDPGSGTTATATVTITDGVVTAVTITEAGSGYTDAPGVTFSDPPGVIDYYFLYSDFGTLITITEFTNTERSTINEGFAWRGPVIIPEEVLDIVEANPDGAINEVLDSILVGSRRYSVIVRPGSDGTLRDPTAADYDATNARSRVLAVVDGQSYKVRRHLTPGHSAMGTFTEFTSGSTFDLGGTTYRFRGNHYYDGGVSSPQQRDFYYNVHDHVIRLRQSDGFGGNHWVSVSEGSRFDVGFRLVGWFDSQNDALSHATANGQRFAYGSGVGAIYTLSGFSAATVDEYTYSWTPSILTSVLPVVFPDQTTGLLRDPTVADWNANTGKGRVMALDGDNVYRVRRDHPTTTPPTATYDEIYIGTVLRFNGGNSEPGRGFRGVFHGDSDVHSPANGNVYLNRDTRHWRIYLNGSWRDLDVSTIFYAAEDAEPYPWKGYHGSEYWAVRSVDAVNEYVAWDDSLYITESFDAGATNYEYHWENIVPDAPTLSSDDANLLAQLHEFEADDATLTAGTIGANIIGWTSSGVGEGSIDPNVPSGSDLIQISRVTTDETDTDIQNRLYVVATEASGEEKYDGAHLRLTHDGNFHLFQLEPLNHVLNDQRYVSTEHVPTGLHFDAADEILINIENPDSTNELSFGRPWLWHVPFASGATADGNVGLLRAKYLVSSNTATTVDNAGWDTILTQEVTTTDATERVYVDATVTIQATTGDMQCNIRVARGTTLVGAAVEGDFNEDNDVRSIPIRQMDTPGTGSHTYNVEAQAADADDCEVNEGGTSSFATIEVLAANP